MTKDLLEKILSHIDGYVGKLKTLRLTFGLKILVAVAVLLVVEGRMNLKTTDINRLIETLGVKSLAGAQ